MKEIKLEGAAEGKKSITSREVQTLILSLSRTLTHAEAHESRTGADTHWIFNLQSDLVWRTFHVRLQCPLYLASKFRPSIKAKFSMT